MWKLKSGKSFKEYISSAGASKAIIILMVGVLLAAAGSVGNLRTDKEESEGLEVRVAEMCSMTEGVGDCRVMLSYTDGGETVFAAVILCEGAESAEVKSRVTDMICSLFGIGSNRVSVLKLSE